MKVLVCETTQVEQVPFYGGRLSWKFIHGINIADSVSETIT